jgi:catechol 2,3-dioxygenase-like lactoylglutathione lyase family enzyme
MTDGAFATTLHHAGITVGDMDRALAFWRDALGMEVVVEQHAEGGYFGEVIGESGARCHVVQLAFPGGGARLELFAFEQPFAIAGPGPRRPVETGFAHVCARCADLDDLLARLERAGGRRIGDPVDVTRGANTGARAVYVRDPDGLVVELLQPPAAA